ncbi:MAG: hypothetical protein HYT36_00020 [Candidatus Staskawiczbacteria bacterium]|nr:hypothetical protein [Candidatus Staskawiczbacteria bacterium]
MKFVVMITDGTGFKNTRIVKAINFRDAFEKIDEDDKKNGNYLVAARKVEIQIIDKEVR